MLSFPCDSSRGSLFPGSPAQGPGGSVNEGLYFLRQR